MNQLMSIAMKINVIKREINVLDFYYGKVKK